MWIRTSCGRTASSEASTREQTRSTRSKMRNRQALAACSHFATGGVTSATAAPSSGAAHYKDIHSQIHKSYSIKCLNNAELYKLALA